MKYILKRLGFYLVAFLGAITLNFFLPRLMPGDPVQMYIARLYESGGRIEESTIRAVEELFGFNSSEPLFISYLNYVRNIFTGNWGYSFSNYPQTVTQAMSRGLRWTLFLMGSSLCISFIINNFLGVLVAWKRGTKFDTALTVGGQVISNIPAIIVALFISYTLAHTGVFPRGYAVTPLMIHSNFLQFALNVMYHAFLPVLCIVSMSLNGIMGMRANMINQLGEDYVVMATAKGIPDKKVMITHSARNALLPVVTSFAMQFGYILGGSLIIESVFNYPGLGNVMLRALNGRDYPLMQGVLLLSTLIMLSANFLADLAVLWLDPRIRTEGGKD